MSHPCASAKDLTFVVTVAISRRRSTLVVPGTKLPDQNFNRILSNEMANALAVADQPKDIWSLSMAKIEKEPRDSYSVASELGEVYYIRLDAENEQKELRSEFFKAASLATEAKALAQKTIEIPMGMASSEAEAFALRYNPGWRLVRYTIDNDKIEKVVIEEDPNYKPHVEVVLVPPVDENDPGGVWDSEGHWHPGYVITKEIRSGSAMIDDERMREEEPGLWKAITEYPSFDLYCDLAEYWGIDYDPEAIVGFLAENGVEPVLSDPSTWSNEDIEAVGRYTYEGPKTVALKVRYAKDDESDTKPEDTQEEYE
jgi:hypothetical protein